MYFWTEGKALSHLDMKKKFFYLDVTATQSVLRPLVLPFGILDEVIWKGYSDLHPTVPLLVNSSDQVVRKVRLKGKKKHHSVSWWTTSSAMEESAGRLSSSLGPSSARRLRRSSHQVGLTQTPPRGRPPTSEVQNQQALLFLHSNQYWVYLFTPRSQQRGSKIRFKFFWWYSANWARGCATQTRWSVQERCDSKAVLPSPMLERNLIQMAFPWWCSLVATIFLNFLGQTDAEVPER